MKEGACLLPLSACAVCVVCRPDLTVPTRTVPHLLFLLSHLFSSLVASKTPPSFPFSPPSPSPSPTSSTNFFSLSTHILLSTHSILSHLNFNSTVFSPAHRLPRPLLDPVRPIATSQPLRARLDFSLALKIHLCTHLYLAVILDRPRFFTYFSSPQLDPWKLGSGLPSRYLLTSLSSSSSYS